MTNIGLKLEEIFLDNLGELVVGDIKLKSLGFVDE
jgi:hypothetical protein